VGENWEFASAKKRQISAREREEIYCIQLMISLYVNYRERGLLKIYIV
jgi:hypothetical protein